MTQKKQTRAEQQNKRGKKWDQAMAAGTPIMCLRHPDRVCNRSTYRHNGHRYCGSCKNRRANGTLTPQQTRKYQKQNYKRIVNRTHKYGSFGSRTAFQSQYRHESTVEVRRK